MSVEQATPDFTLVEFRPGGELAHSALVGIGQGSLELLSALVDYWNRAFGTGVRLTQVSAAPVGTAMLNAHLFLGLVTDRPSNAAVGGLHPLRASKAALRFSIVIHLPLDREPPTGAVMAASGWTMIMTSDAGLPGRSNAAAMEGIASCLRPRPRAGC